MSIDRIIIKNYKSLRNVNLSLTKNYELFCFFGKNGSGKSNIIDAVKYFYDCLNNPLNNENVIDSQNPYANSMEIELVFNLSRLYSIKSNSFIDSYIECFYEYTNTNDQLSIKLIQSKSGEIKWYPENAKLRSIIARVFPLYIFDTRFIDVVDWNTIWNIIADLSITNLKIQNDEFKGKYNEFLIDTFGEKATKALKIVEDELKSENINISEYDYLNRFKSLILSRLGGVEIMQEGYKLDYFSDGMNSLKYISLALRIIPKLASTGWKSPIVMIDEIEIGLHPQYIKGLVHNLKQFESTYSDLIITTHSPVLAANLLKSGSKTAMLRVYTKGSYTVVEKINQLTKSEYMPLLTMTEASYYFSDMILSVEGISEIQLFSHEKLLELFPYMNNIEIVSYDSNNSRLKLIRPDFMKFNIPSLLIVDRDKILNVETRDNKKYYKIKNDQDANPLSRKDIEKSEILQFYQSRVPTAKKSQTKNMRMFIKKILKTYELNVDVNKLYLNDTYHDELILKLKQYCLQNDVYPVNTTVEGVIVNENSVVFVYDWLHEECGIDKIKLLEILEKDNHWSTNIDLKYRSIIIRLLLNGKMETSQTVKQFDTSFSTNVSNDIKNLKNMIANNLGGKADGWIISFMNYFFKHYINPLNTYGSKVNKFKNVFPELYNILNIIEHMLE